MAMLLGHPIPFGKHICSLFYFHDTITVALRRYKTAILSKQSTFLGLYQGAAAAGAENDLRLCARRWRIKKRGRREGGREKICAVCTFESFLNISWPFSPTHPFTVFLYMSNRNVTYFHFSLALA